VESKFFLEVSTFIAVEVTWKGYRQIYFWLCSDIFCGFPITTHLFAKLVVQSGMNKVDVREFDILSCYGQKGTSSSLQFCHTAEPDSTTVVIFKGLKALKAHAADNLRTGSEVTIFSLTISMLLVNHVY